MILSFFSRLIDVPDGEALEALRRLWNIPPGGVSAGRSHGVVATVAVDPRTPGHLDPRDRAARPDGLEITPVSGDSFRVADPTRPGGAVEVRVGAPSLVTVLGEAPVSLTALEVAMSEVLAATGLIRLHAAAITDGRRTLALLGPSGRGKSTTALRAARAGWRLVAEDGLFVDLATLEVRGCDEAIRLRPAAAEALVGGARAPEPGERLLVPFDRFGNGIGHGPLTDLVHLRRSADEEPRWSSMTDAETVMALFEASGAPISVTVRTVFARGFPEVVRQTHNMALSLGSLTSAFGGPPPAGTSGG